MSNKLLKLVAATCMACTLHLFAWAQVDPHFSQYYIQPMSMNPALTGAIEGDYRVAAVWRNQYSNTLVTRGISGEVVTAKNCNFGFNLVNQATSDKAYNYTNANISMAYTGVRFGPRADKYLVMAIQCGFINRRFDASKLQFGDQWMSGVGFDPTAGSNEVFERPSVFDFDAGAGIAYYDAAPGKTVTVFGGIGAFHLTRSAYPYLQKDNGGRMDIRYSFHAGARIIASDLISIVPSALYMKEGLAEEKMLGAYLQLYASESTDFIFGANYRIKDAVIPFAGVYYKGFTIGLSYDVTVSALSTAATRNNSLELSLSFVGKKKNSVRTQPFYCPRF